MDEPIASKPSAPSAGLVLVVDDEEQNRMLLRDPLEAKGYEVIEAANGMEALERLSQRIPDVILLDVMMPQMDGFEVCRRVKSNPKIAHVPVLMVTALCDRKERLLGIEAGANDFLTKPVDLHDILLRVGNAAYTRRLFDQLQVEQQKAERLLLNTLPKPIADRMKAGESNIVDRCADVTVLFAELVGFNALASNIGAEQIVYFLNEIFSAFDALAETHEIEKIKTMGDIYMAAGGVPVSNALHAENALELALAMKDQVQRFNQQYGIGICVRIGIHSGPVIAGVVGRQKFCYDLWGETVLIASKLAGRAEPGSTLVSEASCERLKHSYRLDRRQQMSFEGLQAITAFTLYGRSPSVRAA